MKKSLIALAVAGMVTLGGGIAAFANDSSASAPQNKGSQNQTTCVQGYMSEGKTFEEAKKLALDSKYARVDAAVEKGTITKERGEEIKAEMKTNSDNCATPGENKGTHKGYGLGKDLNGKGNSNGKSAGKGLGKGACSMNQ